MAGMEIFAWTSALFFILFMFLNRNQKIKTHLLGIEIPLVILLTIVVLGLKINAPDAGFIFAIGRLRNFILLFVFTYLLQIFKDQKRFIYILLIC